MVKKESKKNSETDHVVKLHGPTESRRHWHASHVTVGLDDRRYPMEMLVS